MSEFWEIGKREIEDRCAELRNKDREMEELEERHQVEIKVRLLVARGEQAASCLLLQCKRVLQYHAACRRSGACCSPSTHKGFLQSATQCKTAATSLQAVKPCLCGNSMASPHKLGPGPAGACCGCKSRCLPS